MGSALGGALPVIGGIVGNLESQGSQNAALGQTQAGLAQVAGLSPPDAAQLQVDFQQYQLTGQMTPALQQVMQQNPSLLNNYQNNPQTTQAQMAALQKLQEYGTGGLQPQDIAALNQVQQQAVGQANAQNASVMQQMQQQGQGGSGAQLAAELQNGQSAANSQLQAGLNIQGQAAQRAMQALASAGQLGGQMQAQNFNQAAAQAAAQNAINQFNTANSQSVQGQNVGALNQAQLLNLQQEQGIANANTGLANQQALQNVGATQQAYQDAAQKASLYQNPSQNLSNAYMNQAANTQALWGGVGQGLGDIATAQDPTSSGGGSSGSGSTSSGTGGSDAANVGTSASDSFTMPDFGAAHGGMIQGYANGGEVYNPMNNMCNGGAIGYAQGGQVNDWTNTLAHNASPNGYPIQHKEYKNGDDVQYKDNGGMIQSAMALAPLAIAALSKGGEVQHMDGGGMLSSVMSLAPLALALLAKGGKVPGKAKERGDKKRNDVVPVVLSPGEIVLPRSVVQSNSDDVILNFIKHAKGEK